MKFNKDQENLFLVLLAKKMDEIKYDVMLEAESEPKLRGELPDPYERAVEFMTMAKKFNLIDYEEEL